MGFVRYILCFISVLLFAALGGSAAALPQAAGIAQSVFAGSVDKEKVLRDKGGTLNRAELVGAFAGYLFSGGKGENVSAGSSTARSGFKNNYLWHSQSDMLQWAKYRLAECEREGGCSAQDLEFYSDRIAFFEGLDRFTDEALRAACDADPTGGTCRAYVADELCAAEARSTAACGGVPGFGTQRWGYHMPDTVRYAEMYDRGTRDEYESIGAAIDMTSPLYLRCM